MKNGYAILKWCMALAAAFWLTSPAVAAQSASTNYAISSSLFTNGGGQQTASINYRQTGMLGYSFAQVSSSSTNYTSGLAINTLLPATLGLSPSSLTFTNQDVGTTSATQAVTLSNSGAALATISSISANGDFAQNNNCGATLAGGTSCTINVSITPTTAGARSGSLSVSSDATGSPHTISLSGTGVAVAVPAVSLNPTSLTFAARNIGNPSAAQVVTLTNTGSGVLNIASIVTSGDFARTTTCGATLGAGANCTISVTFTATAMGTRNGAVTLTSDASSSPDTLTLTGTGTATRSDFNLNGKADILWRNTIGQNVLWFMNGAAVSSYAFTTTAATNWSAVGVTDFNGDGKADILWRDQTAGTNAVWFMNGATLSSYAFTSTANSSWSVAGTGDFDGDGKQNDILWFNATTRQTVVWLTNNGQMASYGYVYGIVPAGWSIAGVGDFDGNGKSDILWRNTNGTNAIWFMNGTRLASTAFTATASGIWSIKGVADFDGDGKADIFWQDTAGNTYVWLMNGAATKGLAPSIFVGTAWTALQFADFNGDGKADILWRNAAGATYVWLMNGLALPTYAPSMSAPMSWTAIGK